MMNIKTAKAGLTGLLVLGLVWLASPNQVEAGHHKCGKGHCGRGGLSLFHSGKCCSPWKLGHKHKCRTGCGESSCGCGSGSIADHYYQGAVYGLGNSPRVGCQSCQSGGGVAGFNGMPAGEGASPPLAMQPMPMAPPRRPTILHYPGTRGTAYMRPTRMMPADGPEGHPRDAGLDIYAPGATDIRVVALNPQRDEMVGYRDPANEDIWEFVTKRPLIPGIQHVYQVYAIFPETGRVPQTRRVRLIMGRIVELSYKPYPKH
ncbi:hypothetical protein [Gimesia fumaroli]|jgi:hypothetical protein|uniref:TIGR03000 domain-containing protein n=1 Tax=Gimesia fumaroli TaxID=2527976 RepID=A0A518I6F3_9PLAN|nr:hypothetical protein [Gimesia fumaroli]QDV48639.1 hypothetical protein Enr17x_06520 [Gimesia fumaroli]